MLHPGDLGISLAPRQLASLPDPQRFQLSIRPRNNVNNKQESVYHSLNLHQLRPSFAEAYHEQNGKSNHPLKRHDFTGAIEAIFRWRAKLWNGPGIQLELGPVTKAEYQPYRKLQRPATAAATKNPSKPPTSRRR